eukprot:1304776-Pleurochrysis_carterae.AAC.1
MITVADMAKHPGITICGVNPNAFGGWHVQIYEMLQAGLDVTADYDVQFLGKHENCILETVKTFSCDVGVARTETIERLVLTNQMNASDVFVLSERSAEYNFPQARHARTDWSELKKTNGYVPSAHVPLDLFPTPHLSRAILRQHLPAGGSRHACPEVPSATPFEP